MNKSNKKGQTLVETALVLLLLLIIFLGIAEISRAWFTKNSLKNAVRQGARVAAVLSPASTEFTGGNTSFSCTTATTCPNTDKIVDAVCCQPGIPKLAENNTAATVCCNCDPPTPGTCNAGTLADCNALTAGGTVTVCATSTFNFVIGNSPWPWPKSITLVTDATMRYE